MQEYGSAIYAVLTPRIVRKTYTKKYKFLFWTIKKTITETSVMLDVKYSYTKPNIGKDGRSVTPNLVTVHKIVSTVHTHANYDPKYDNENFSDGLFSDIGWSNFFAMNSYVVTPGGFLKKYTFANRKNRDKGISIISGDIPWDPNSPEH